MIFINEKYMALHVVLLVFLALGNGFVSLVYVTQGNNTLFSWTIYSAIDFLVTGVMLFIMWKVSGKTTQTNYVEI